MRTLSDILFESLLFESVASVEDINDAIDNHRFVEITYRSDGGTEAMGHRVIGVVAYGLTKAGNECIRAFEYRGDSLSKIVPTYKIFRLDRIMSWRPTKGIFVIPPSNDRFPFNPYGDKTMISVFKVAKFDKRRWNPNRKKNPTATNTNPKMDKDKDAELNTPSNTTEIETKEVEAPMTTGPKTKD